MQTNLPCSRACRRSRDAVDSLARPPSDGYSDQRCCGIETVPMQELLQLQGDHNTATALFTSTAAKGSVSRARGAQSRQPPTSSNWTRSWHPKALSSHSFRRGGAQHANGNRHVSAQWIFVRGAWNMSMTNKAFAYVFNTTQEDHRVSKVLSGWSLDADVALDTLERFDTQTQTTILRFQSLLFNTCVGLQEEAYTVDTHVLDTLTARLLRAYPLLKTWSTAGPVVGRIHACAEAVGVRDSLLAWAHELHCAYNKEKMPPEQLLSNRELLERLDMLEGKPKMRSANTRSIPAESVNTVPDHRMFRKKSQATNLSSVWYAWYAGEPRLWASSDRKLKSEAKDVIAYMKLFVADALDLDPPQANYRDQVLDIGGRAEKLLLAFQVENGIRAKGSSSVVKHIRALQRVGKLDMLIREYDAQLALCNVVDPAPKETHRVLAPTGDF